MVSLVLSRYKGYMLKMPNSFVGAGPAQIQMVCNGMGAKGAGFLVPDTMYGLNMEAAGDIHDWMYAHPEGRNQRFCDDIFLQNMNRIIEQNGGWEWVQWLRKRRAQKYYWAVREFGHRHFGGV